MSSFKVKNYHVELLDRALAGKMYNRAVGSKLFYEALHRMYDRQFQRKCKCHR